jgi:glycosyltransferase involved in cell wall biosynthesis
VAPEFSRNLHPALAMAKRVGLGLRRGQPLILGVFRLSPEKRPLDFVRIIAVLRKKYPSLRAVICGDGPMRGEVQRLMRRLKLETVIFLPGFVTDIPVWLRSADLLLHTSSSESLPTVLLEAQAAGLPVVCTDTPGGGSAEALADTLSPFMSKVGDIQGLAASCAKLLRQKGKLTKPLQKQMRRDYSPARMAQQSLRIMGLPHHMVSARKRGRCV